MEHIQWLKQVCQLSLGVFMLRAYSANLRQQGLPHTQALHQLFAAS